MGNAFNTPHFNNLEVLEFVKVPLQIFYYNSLNGLKHLKILRLIGTEHFKAGKSFLMPCKELKVFMLSKCGLKPIILNIFESVEFDYLYKVNIKYCRLNGSITEKTFWGLKALRELRLINDDIKQIEPRSFFVMRRTLKYLNLESNKLTTLPSGIFKYPRDNCIFINLQNNPWHCDCELDDLRDFIKTYPFVKIYNNVTCQSPSNLKGTTLNMYSSFCKSVPLIEQDPNLMVNRFSSECDTMNDGEYDGIHFGLFETLGKLSSLLPAVEEAHLTESTPEYQSTTPLIRIENGKLLIINSDLFKDRKLIGFKQEAIENFKMVPSKCLIQSDDSNKFDIERDLKPNQIYRFCAMKNGSTVVIPRECISFHSIVASQSIDSDPFILMKDKPIAIICFVSNFILIFLIGGVFSIIFAKCFPTKFQALCLPNDGVETTEAKLEKENTTA